MSKLQNKFSDPKPTIKIAQKAQNNSKKFIPKNKNAKSQKKQKGYKMRVINLYE